MNRVFLISLFIVTISVTAQTDLSDVFATPTQAEIDAVKADWASRDVGSYNWTVINTGLFNGMTVDVISHDTYGDADFTHYGLVRYPKDYNPILSYPVIMLNHGGQNGVGVEILFQMNDCFEGFIVGVPSFRGEELRTNSLGFGNFTSEAENSEFDGDIDDALAMLNGILDNVSGADENRISIFGGSRGGAVTYLTSIREPRVKRAVVYFGATDHITHPGYQEIIEDVVDGNSNSLNPPRSTIMNYAVTPYLNNEITLAQARHNLLMRSVYYFTDLLPPFLQVHHGALDFVVEVEHSQRLATKMANEGVVTPNFEYYEYSDGNHGANIDPNNLKRDYLCEILTLTATVELDPNCINIYHNPDPNVFTITGIDSSYTIQILDANGSVFQTLTTTDTELAIDITSLPAGMYFISIVNQNNSLLSVEKILKGS